MQYVADRVSGGRQLEVDGGAGCYGARLGGDATQCCNDTDLPFVLIMLALVLPSSYVIHC